MHSLRRGVTTPLEDEYNLFFFVLSPTLPQTPSPPLFFLPCSFFSSSLLLLDKRSLRHGVGDLGRHGDGHGTLAGGPGGLSDKVAGEAGVQGALTLEVLDLVVGQLEAEGLDVVLEVLDLAAADDGEDVGGLLHDVGEGHGRQALQAVLARDLFEGGADLFFLGRLAPAEHAPQPFALLLAGLELFLGLELAPADHVPGGQGHAEVAGHGDDVPLKVPEHDVPPALVHAEGGLAVRPGVRVGRRHHPGRRVRDAQVQNLALFHQDVEAVHDFLDRSGPVLFRSCQFST